MGNALVRELTAVNDLRRHNGPLAAELTAAVADVIADGWYVLGRRVTAFEEAFAAYCGTRFAVGVGNGTDAIELALRAVGVHSGRKVALVANAGGYGTVAARALGAVPVYVDVDPVTMTMNVAGLEETLRGHDIAAVLVTHLYGRLAELAEITAVVGAAGVALVEDCAQAHGATRDGRRAGSWGDAACFSFYPTKNLGALGDGGAVLTSDPAVADRVRMLRQYGWDRKYHPAVPHGRNSRLDEMQAALLSVKLSYLDGWNARRSELATRYRDRINHHQVTLPPPGGAADVAHLFVIRVPARESLTDHLSAQAIPYDIHYPVPDAGSPSLTETERACREVLTLPCFPELTDDEVDRVATVVNRWRP